MKHLVATHSKESVYLNWYFPLIANREYLRNQRNREIHTENYVL